MTDSRRAERRVLILGAAGRDFHDFNTCFRADPQVRVVGITALADPHRAGHELRAPVPSG